MYQQMCGPGKWVVIAPPLLPSASVIISNRVGSRNKKEDPSKAVNLLLPRRSGKIMKTDA